MNAYVSSTALTPQSSPGWPKGYVPTADEWNRWFAQKVDYDNPTINNGPFIPISGGTMTGSLILKGDPVSANEAATKSYVDALIVGGGAPTDGRTYGRNSTGWDAALSLATGGTVTGAVTFAGAGTPVVVTNNASVGGTFNSKAMYQTDGTRQAALTLHVPTVAAAQAYNYATAGTNPIAVSVGGYYQIGDTGGGVFDYVAPVVKTTSASTSSGATIPISDTSGLAVGMGVAVTTGILPQSYIQSMVANTSITMNKAVSGTVASGATLNFMPSVPDGALFIQTTTVFAGMLCRRCQSRVLSFEEAGMKGDYVVPAIYKITADTATGNVLTMASTAGIQLGWWAHHPNIPFGTTVTGLTSTTVTLSQPVTGAGVLTNTWVGFNPVPTDNTDFLNNLVGSASPVLALGITLRITEGRLYYLGPGAAGGDLPRINNGCNIIGPSSEMWQGRGVGPAAPPVLQHGLVLQPGTHIRLNGINRVQDVLVVRAGVPQAPGDVNHYALMMDQWQSENGVARGSVVTLTTNGVTVSGSNVLNFASTAGVTVGMYVFGYGWPWPLRVLAVTATQVTIRGNCVRQIAAGTPMSFSTQGFRSMGLVVNGGNCVVDGCYVLGFHTGIISTGGSYRMARNVCDCPNGADLSGIGEGSLMQECRMAADYTFGANVGQTYNMNVTTALTVASPGINHKPGDLLLTEASDLVKVATVDGSGGVLTLDPKWMLKGMTVRTAVTVAARCISSDPQAGHGDAGGIGTGCTLTRTTTVIACGMNFYPGVGLYVHDRADGCTFEYIASMGHQVDFLLSNCWISMLTCGCEGRAVPGVGLGTKGFWMVNSPSYIEIYNLYAGGQDNTVLVEAADAPYAFIRPKPGEGVLPYIRMCGGLIQNFNGLNPGGTATAPGIVIGPYTRGIIEGISFGRVGPEPTDPVIDIGPNVFGWKLENIGLNTNYMSGDTNWLRVDPTSERYVSIVHGGHALGHVNAATVWTDGPLWPTFQGPNDRNVWPQQISFDPTSITPIDGSPTALLTLHSQAGGTARSTALLFGRGGMMHQPGIVGVIDTTPSGLVIDVPSGSLLVTTATVPPGQGGAGYNVGYKLRDPIGGEWTVASVDANGQVLTVTNATPAAYSGTAPTNPVATTTNDAPTGAQISATLAGGGALGAATVTIGGVGYYQARTHVYVGAPGLWQNQIGTLTLAGYDPTGTQAVYTPTVVAGAVTAVAATVPGTAYTGIPPLAYVDADPPSGCMLNLGAGVAPNAITIAPSGATTALNGPVSIIANSPPNQLTLGNVSGTGWTGIRFTNVDTTGAAACGFMTVDRAGSARWSVEMGVGIETGGNQGSIFNIKAFKDDGTPQSSNAISIRRSDNLVTFGGAIGANGISSTGSLTVSSTTTLNGPLQANLGQTFGSVLGSSNDDLAKHIALWGTTFGFNVTSGRLNYVAGSSSQHAFRVAGSDVLTMSGTAITTNVGLAVASGGMSVNGLLTANNALSVTGAINGTAGINGASLSASNGVVTIGTNTTAGGPTINGPVTTTRQLRWQTAGVVRWAMGLSTNAEAGSSAGADIGLNAYDDSGTLIGSMLLVTRATGALRLTNSLSVWGTTPPAAKPAVSGSRGGNAALASLLTALASYGLLTDSSTA